VTIYQAAEDLGKVLIASPWLIAVGVSNESIIIYTKKTVPQEELSPFRNGWKGFPIVVKKTGVVRPA
jgi:hypothetical protein